MVSSGLHLSRVARSRQYQMNVYRCKGHVTNGGYWPDLDYAPNSVCVCSSAVMQTWYGSGLIAACVLMTVGQTPATASGREGYRSPYAFDVAFRRGREKHPRNTTRVRFLTRNGRGKGGRGARRIRALAPRGCQSGNVSRSRLERALRDRGPLHPAGYASLGFALVLRAQLESSALICLQ
jgi:hypothetical protein